MQTHNQVITSQRKIRKPSCTLSAFIVGLFVSLLCLRLHWSLGHVKIKCSNICVRKGKPQIFTGMGRYLGIAKAWKRSNVLLKLLTRAVKIWIKGPAAEMKQTMHDYRESDGEKAGYCALCYALLAHKDLCFFFNYFYFYSVQTKCCFWPRKIFNIFPPPPRRHTVVRKSKWLSEVEWRVSRMCKGMINAHEVDSPLCTSSTARGPMWGFQTLLAESRIATPHEEKPMFSKAYCDCYRDDWGTL